MGDFELLIKFIIQMVKVNIIPFTMAVILIMAMVTKWTGDKAWARKILKGDK